MKVLLHRLIGWFEFPHRLLAVRSAVRRPGAQLLDAGCGNHSPSVTKRFFPDVEYSGIDNSDWNRDVGDAAAIDHFYELSLDDEAVLAKVPDDRFDAVVCSHVLEHLQDPTMTANALVRKLRPGGLAYFEVPSPRTVDWPHAKDGWWGIRGCLNFYDDPTHVAPVDLADIASSLRSEGHVVTGPKRRRLARRVVLFPARRPAWSRAATSRPLWCGTLRASPTRSWYDVGAVR